MNMCVCVQIICTCVCVYLTYIILLYPERVISAHIITSACAYMNAYAYHTPMNGREERNSMRETSCEQNYGL